MIQNENLKSQEHLDNIQKWTNDKKMLLNTQKTKNMIFNFSKDNQFTTESHGVILHNLGGWWVGGRWVGLAGGQFLT